MTTRIDAENARARARGRILASPRMCLVEYSTRADVKPPDGGGRGKKEKNSVDDRTEKPRREPGLAEHGQKARVYAHKVDLAPLNMHIGLGRRRS